VPWASTGTTAAGTSTPAWWMARAGGLLGAGCLLAILETWTPVSLAPKLTL